MRTTKGNPTAKARKKTGMKGGKFPVFDHKSAMSALKLRHHGKGISASAVIARVRAWARRNNDKAALAAADAASKKDKPNGGTQNVRPTRP